TVVDYLIGLTIDELNSKSRKKALLIISLVVNLGLLGFFKYFNFFVDSWVDAFESLGIDIHRSTLNIILQVGISFYRTLPHHAVKSIP
ncbi:hypothetical protein FNJ87_17640, partial [Nonlabens mediterrranea]|nr:hypothetical protein [Nonlabens mediterrranea]